jgi:hypothetical protein
VKYIKATEAVQQKFTKSLHGLQYLSYAERLQETQLESLQERRTKADLNFFPQNLIQPCTRKLQRFRQAKLKHDTRLREDMHISSLYTNGANRRAYILFHLSRCANLEQPT